MTYLILSKGAESKSEVDVSLVTFTRVSLHNGYVKYLLECLI